MSTKKEAAKKKREAQRPRQSPLTVVIRANQWARGKMRGKHKKGRDTIGNALLNVEDKTMCCLGFDGIACGLSPEEITDVGFPQQVLSKTDVAKSYKSAWKSRLKTDGNGEHSEPAQYIAGDINDDDSITDDERIKRLRPVFAAVNPPRRLVWRPDL